MASEGLTRPGFERVREAFDANFEAGAELGAGFCAILDDEIIVDLWGGFQDRAKTKPWAPDTIVPVYSTTKPIAALVIAKLVSDGAFDYETRVAALWPEFAVEGKKAVTIGQMLSHQAGLCGFVERIDPALWLDPPALAGALAALKPMWPPGTANGYHALTWGYLVGELAKRASGRTLGTILREDICAPLGIDFQIGLPESDHARAADIQRPNAPPDLGPPNEFRRAAFGTPWSQPNRGGAEWRRVEIPSANGHGTARAVAQLFAAYAEAGHIQTERVLDPLAYAELIKRRIKGPDLVLPYEMDWAAGVMRNNNLAFGPNPESLGHFGWGGSMGFADPQRGLSAGYVMNKQSNALLGDARAERLIGALYECV